MGWLEHFLDDCDNVLAYMGEIGFLVQGRAKSLQGALRVVFLTIEASIDDVLDMVAQGLKEDSNDQG